MKGNWFYLVFFLFICSCNRALEDNRMSDADFSVAKETTVEMSREEAHLSLATQKLKEELEVAKLKENHPEFIDLNLSNAVFPDNVDQATKINSLDLLESRTQGDTTFLKLILALGQNQKIKLDTIFATVISKKMKIEEEELLTTEFSFRH